MPYRFEWNDRKAMLNMRNHGVSFDEASTVFDRTMKKTVATEREPDPGDDLRPEYIFDYHQARPNRFAGQVDKSQVVVVLDPDVSEVFKTPESVNAILRALIKTMPTTPVKPDRKSPSPSTRKSVLR